MWQRFWLTRPEVFLFRRRGSWNVFFVMSSAPFDMGPAVKVSPLIKTARWGLLLAGVVYGWKRWVSATEPKWQQPALDKSEPFRENIHSLYIYLSNGSNWKWKWQHVCSFMETCHLVILTSTLCVLRKEHPRFFHSKLTIIVTDTTSWRPERTRSPPTRPGWSPSGRLRRPRLLPRPTGNSSSFWPRKWDKR